MNVELYISSGPAEMFFIRMIEKKYLDREGEEQEEGS